MNYIDVYNMIKEATSFEQGINTMRSDIDRLNHRMAVTDQHNNMFFNSPAFDAAMTPTTDIGRAITARGYRDPSRAAADIKKDQAQRQRDDADYADTKYNSNRQYLNTDRYLNSSYGSQQKAQLTAKNDQDYARSRGLQPGNAANGQQRYNNWYNGLSSDYRNKIEQGAKNIAAYNQAGTNTTLTGGKLSGTYTTPANAKGRTGTINWGADNRKVNGTPYSIPEGKSQATINGKTQTWNAGTSPFSQKEIAALQGKTTPGSNVQTRTLAQARSFRNSQQPQNNSNFGTFAGLKGGPTMRPNALGNSPFARA